MEVYMMETNFNTNMITETNVVGQVLMHGGLGGTWLLSLFGVVSAGVGAIAGIVWLTIALYKLKIIRDEERVSHRKSELEMARLANNIYSCVHDCKDRIDGSNL